MHLTDCQAEDPAIGVKIAKQLRTQKQKYIDEPKRLHNDT